jgi:hypothetical protein
VEGGQKKKILITIIMEHEHKRGNFGGGRISGSMEGKRKGYWR